MMSNALSVVICTHDPRPQLLQETLDALRAQTLSADQWVLVIVDNASKEPVANAVSLDWHRAARIGVQPRLRLTHSPLRGIPDASAPTFSVVDDHYISTTYHH